jgi:retron-type reverse transcriptase
MLTHAYRCSRANDGTPGVDGQTFEDIEAYGVERWLGELAQTRRDNTYQAAPSGRRYVPKPNGQARPLGIATIRDRGVQTAAMVVLEPIVEADLLPEQ